MKICIPIDPIPHTGKAYFLHRLIPSLKKLGVEITLDKFEKVDITLGIGKFLYEPTSGKMVLRLGPAHVSKHEDYKKLNKRKAKAVWMADGVIYQSEFSKKMCNCFLGKTNEPTAVIFNGCGIAKNINKESSSFVCSTRKWIPQKRLKAILKAWEICDFESAKLYVLGDTLGVRKELRGVHYIGKCSERQVKYYLSKSEIMVHVVYLDAMPNSVVEALAHRCRVIHTDSGGTKEVVLESGVRIKEDEWNFKPTNLLKPLKLDPYRLSAAMVWQLEKSSPFENSHIDINNIAEQYVSFFQKVLAQ